MQTTSNLATYHITICYYFSIASHSGQKMTVSILIKHSIDL